jgi:hypothetical protein
VPDDNPSTTAGPPESSGKARSSLAGTIHYVVLGLCLAGGLAYWALKPPTVNPMADPRAAEAMALVQTHRAQGAPTLRQAMTQRAQAIAARGQGVRLGEWRVEQQRDDIYLVKIDVREQGTKQWFEREYVWRVDLGKRSVIPLSMPAEDLMPLGETGPLTDGDRPPVR